MPQVSGAANGILHCSACIMIVLACQRLPQDAACTLRQALSTRYMCTKQSALLLLGAQQVVVTPLQGVELGMVHAGKQGRHDFDARCL